jgi:polar amino acid transport system substrate-binding protein
MKGFAYRFFASLLLTTAPVHSAEILLANNAPYTIDQPTRSGFLLDIVKHMERTLGVNFPVKFMGWKEVQTTAASGRDIMFFPYSRTAEREPNYTWLQKLWDIEEAFVTPPAAMAIDDYEEGRRIGSVGVVGGSTGHAELVKRGFTNLKEFANATALTEALANKEVNAAYTADVEIKYAWRTAQNPGDLVVGKTLARRELYMAASKDSPELKSVDWARAYDAARKDGAIDAAYRTYFGSKSEPPGR